MKLLNPGLRLVIFSRMWSPSALKGGVQLKAASTDELSGGGKFGSAVK